MRQDHLLAELPWSPFVRVTAAMPAVGLHNVLASTDALVDT